MTTDEAKALFALMGWRWKPRPLAKGNNLRGRMPDIPWQGCYEVFVNEVMAANVASSFVGNTYSEYERYDVDRCLTRYAELYLEYIANGQRQEETLPERSRA